ncbi:MAG: hypothetical protein JXA18_16685 [Chitinispirillaceae bacterium]|nr:hypothetical protein [Chitinispirillaceae bacterium]
MPRLFDLLSDDAKKGLIEENRRIKGTSRKPRQRPSSAAAHPPLSPPVCEITVPDFVALDVETTGLDFKKDRIIEIGAIKFKEGKVAEEFSTFVNPGLPIPAAITDLTGISETDVAGAPVFAAIADRLLGFIGTLPLCGHQIEFDASFLREEFKRDGKPAVNNHLLDTALLSRVLLDPRGRFSLKHVCAAVDVKLDGAHRALNDARASGEVALRLVPKLSHLPLAVRRTIAACAPSSLFKNLLFQSLPGGKPEIAIDFQREKPPAQLSTPDDYRPIDRPAVEKCFGAEGTLPALIDAYRPRRGQQKMAGGVADALNTQSLYIAEAGTGTGKSLAYLIPAALWALGNECRVIVSTRTKNLQDQLVTHDLPVASAATGGRLKFTVLKGRGNYLCQHRFRQLLLGAVGNLSPRERFAVLPLIVWSSATATGDIEEQNLFNPKWFSKIWNIISAEHHECPHRRCPLYQSCFFQRARNRALGSHIVVINHALFFSDLCTEASFFGTDGPIIFDEAHHLESSGYRFLRVELDTSRINLFNETINNLVQRIGGLQEEQNIYECGRELRSTLKQLRKRGGAFLDALLRWAKEKNPAAAEYQIAYREATFSDLPESGAFLQSVIDLIDRLAALRQAIRGHPEPQRHEALGLETQACSEHASQLKADFLYLTAALTDDHVFWTEGNIVKGWAKLCGVPLDVGALLSEIWERRGGTVVFTSATLSIAGSFDYFKRTAGLLPHEARTASEIVKSPFGAHQSIAGAIMSAPEPDAPQFPAYVADTIAALHTAFKKNMLVLFTANSMLSSVHQLLRAGASVNKHNLLAQGVTGSRQIILEEFKKNSQMILLGTDSFWEGIDVPGEACEMVVIPRLPFPVPTHPLTQAVAQRMQEREGESFFSYSVPEAVIRFRQGCGRLIRTSTDRGALIILDRRIVQRGYGKQFIRSIDVDFKVFEDIAGMIENIGAFFASDPQQAAAVSDLTYVPLEDV